MASKWPAHLSATGQNHNRSSKCLLTGPLTRLHMSGLIRRRECCWSSQVLARARGTAGVGGEVTDPDGDTVDPAAADELFSGVITGPNFCANNSLGGATTYAFDSDSDSGICSLELTQNLGPYLDNVGLATDALLPSVASLLECPQTLPPIQLSLMEKHEFDYLCVGRRRCNWADRLGVHGGTE